MFIIIWLFNITRLLVNIIEKQATLRIYTSKDKWHDAKHTVKDGIIKNLSAVKQNLNIFLYVVPICKNFMNNEI